MQPALEYFLKRLYQVAPSDLEAYQQHLHAVEKAFDLHPDHLHACQVRAAETTFNSGPFCWKHVDIQHGMVLEQIAPYTPIMTHKPLMIVHRAPERDPEMCYYAQAFYMAIIDWSMEQVQQITELYSAALLKHCETPESFAFAASLAITWADVLQTSRSDADWERRFWAFGLLATKCIPCPHSCGRVMIMGPDYFEQIDDSLTPNAAITPHTWSIPFSIYATEECTAHLSHPVTYAETALAPGEFIRVPLINPLFVPLHPSHFDELDGHHMCHTIMSTASSKLHQGEIQLKLLRFSEVLSEHMDHFTLRKATNGLWKSRFASITLASTVAMTNVILQADPSMPEVAAAVAVLSKFILLSDFQWNSWYINMKLDLEQVAFDHAVFDPLRTAVGTKLNALVDNYQDICKIIKSI